LNTKERTVNNISAKFQALRAAKTATNVKLGEEFLAENGKREGVMTLPCGLQYEILEKGEGFCPTFTSSVTCHYHGTLIDGTVFDSSVQRGKPATFSVNKVIEGWTLILQMMPIGSKWKVYIPSFLAYGNEQVGMHIAPGSMLIFEITLLS
jgi:FKBP-type peptidyl-prolyl cis-trans isomerase FklB